MLLWSAAADQWLPTALHCLWPSDVDACEQTSLPSTESALPAFSEVITTHLIQRVAYEQAGELNSNGC